MSNSTTDSDEPVASCRTVAHKNDNRWSRSLFPSTKYAVAANRARSYLGGPSIWLKVDQSIYSGICVNAILFGTFRQLLTFA
jgi:hypothetical protein